MEDKKGKRDNSNKVKREKEKIRGEEKEKRNTKSR